MARGHHAENGHEDDQTHTHLARRAASMSSASAAGPAFALPAAGDGLALGASRGVREGEASSETYPPMRKSWRASKEPSVGSPRRSAVGEHRVIKWSARTHALFGLPARRTVREVMLVANRLVAASRQRLRGLPFLPPELWNLILSLQRVMPGGVQVSTIAGTGAKGFLDGPGAAAQVGLMSGVAADPRGGFVFADWSNHRVRRVSLSGAVATVAGSGFHGVLDASGQTAQFNNPTAIATSGCGAVIVADTDNHRVRRIDPDGTVTTLAGSRPDEGWFRDGPANEARFDRPSGVAVALDGSVIVADTNNHRIRRIAVNGDVTTLAGSGVQGYRDGPGERAQFRYVQGIACDRYGNVYVSERFDHRIRKVTPDGTVETLAGSGKCGHQDGAGELARFNRPWGIAVDLDDSVLVADTYNHCIRKIQSDGTVSTLFARGQPMFHYPRGISIDPTGALCVGEPHQIQRVGVPEYYFH